MFLEGAQALPIKLIKVKKKTKPCSSDFPYMQNAN